VIELTSQPNSRVIQELELQPGVRGLWYADNPDSPELASSSVMRISNGKAVVATRAEKLRSTR